MSAQTDDTHDPALTSWVASANGHSSFPIQNLPLGVFGPADGAPRIGVAIGDRIFDLAGAVALLPEATTLALSHSVLNALFALSAADRVALRRRVSALLSDEAHRAAVEVLLHDAQDCVLHLPVAIGDYTDFYTGIHHATNIGRQFRPDAPLLPNYKHVPIAYHGRASTVRPSGTPLVRPRGQRLPPGATMPVFEPTARLDYELELGVWIGEGNAPGEAIPIDEAAHHFAGFCLLNDWSARDMQAWEYQPLGPFLAKNFMTTVSPWVVTAEAMAPYQIAQPPRPAGDPLPLPYLWSAADQAAGAYAIELEVWLSTAAMRAMGLPRHRLSRGQASNMYWTVAQIVTHHTSNGCTLRPGDLLGSGTISTPDDDGRGSLLEITEGGSKPVTLPSGETRSFLEDGDEVTLEATATARGRVSIGFGPCVGRVEPAPENRINGDNR